jgi:glutamate dehydrogenase (NADP+)
MINYASGGKESFSGKKVAISGSGNVAQYAALKVIELGGTVVSLSDSKGSIISESGITPELITEIQALKVARKSLSDIASTSEHKISYKEGVRPWKEVKADVALPCATQNEVSGEEAEALASSGAKFVAEGSNMGCTKEAIDVFEKTRKEKKDSGVWYGPGKFGSNCK